MESQYLELSKRIGLEGSERIPKLYSMIANLDEADLMLAMPADVPTLARKFGRSEEETQKMIDELFKKGLIFPSFKTDPISYRHCRDIIQFHDASILWPSAPRMFLDLWQEWTEAEWPELAKMMTEALSRPGTRIIPVGVSIRPEGQVLAFEDVEEIIQNSKKLAVTKCTCRLIAHKCDRTLEACIQVNNAASYAISRGSGREITKGEALEIARKAEEEGLMHSTFNQRSVDHIICNCCGCCCQFMPVLIQHGIRAVAPSRFQAEVDEDACIGCETCLDRCYVSAIEMVPKNGDEGEQIAQIDPESCLGCGICQVTCEEEAIAMREVRPPDYVPEKAFG